MAPKPKTKTRSRKAAATATTRCSSCDTSVEYGPPRAPTPDARYLVKCPTCATLLDLENPHGATEPG